MGTLFVGAVAVLLITPLLAAPLPVSPRAAESEEIVYQQGVSPSAAYGGASDTFISRIGDKNSNYGAGQVLALHSGDEQAVLMHFNLDGLASGDTVDRAILSVYVSSHPTGTSDLPLALYSVLRPWIETEATWYNATGIDLWTLAGCNSPGVDRASSLSAGATITSTGLWLDLDITALVQSWVADPGANYGLIIKAGSTVSGGEQQSTDAAQDGDQYLLRSGDYVDDPPTRPRLKVRYTPQGSGGPTSTPTVVYGAPIDVVFQQLLTPADYDGTADTYISDYGDPTKNYGSEAAIRLRSNDHRASLVRFDLASIPSYARVYTATLSLYVQSRTNDNPLPVSAHRLLRPWDASVATWYLASSDQRWAFPGANGLTTDRSPDAFASAILTTTSVWTAWDVTNLAMDWVAHSEENDGIILKAGSGPQVEYSLVASHYLANPSLRPKLQITYALPRGPTPVPTATRTSTATPTPTATPARRPTVIVLQYGELPNFGYVQMMDTYISREGDLSMNYGLEPVLTVASGDARAALLRFDLGPIPPWATIQSARLSLYSDSASNGYPVTIAAYGLLRTWIDSEVTWINPTRIMRWSEPGANGLDSDRTAMPAATVVVNSLGDWYDFDVTDMARVWLASGDDNYGVILKGMDGPQVSYDFLSSQYVSAGSALRPKLTVAYTLPSGPSPTPSRTRTPTVTATRTVTFLPVILSAYEHVPASATPTHVADIRP